MIEKRNGEKEERIGNPLQLLKDYHSSFEIHKEEEGLNFSGGLVGSLGYDFVRYSEKLPEENPDEIGIGTIQMMLMTEYIMIDHVAETLTAIVLREPGEEGKKKALEKAAELIAAAKHPAERKEENRTHEGVIVKKSDTLEQYCEKVEKIKHYIREGHIFRQCFHSAGRLKPGGMAFLSIKNCGK